jgi:hypothetical protein
MIQIALVVLSVLLIIIGIKGFTPTGLQFSKNTVLKGRNGKIVGAICIAFGFGLIPLFLLLFIMYSASSAKSVGLIWLGKLSELVI